MNRRCSTNRYLQNKIDLYKLIYLSPYIYIYIYIYIKREREGGGERERRREREGREGEIYREKQT